MNWKNEWKPLAAISGVFLLCYFLPAGIQRFDGAVLGAMALVKWYAREHVILCLVPALFIAGAISVFISQASVMKYFGARANKVLAYAVASVSGTILAVCSCTVLPIFAGIYKRGAGIGPATAFLYSGPAINILAIALTARILGLELGIARAIGAVVFSVVIGLLMHLIYRKEELAKAESQMVLPESEVKRPLWQNTVYFALMTAILVFANWGKPDDPESLWQLIHSNKWLLTAVSSAGFAVVLVSWFGANGKHIAAVSVPVVILSIVVSEHPAVPFAAGAIGLSIVLGINKGELKDWLDSSWYFAKLILPMLFLGILAAGFLLGGPGGQGIIPSNWVASAVGGNSLTANFFASIAGAFMYFATLTEVPILQGLLSSGMGKGPALALLLAGPALSLPSMLVLRTVMGTKKTAVFVCIVVAMSTISGILYGRLFG